MKVGDGTVAVKTQAYTWYPGFSVSAGIVTEKSQQTLPIEQGTPVNTIRCIEVFNTTLIRNRQSRSTKTASCNFKLS